MELFDLDSNLAVLFHVGFALLCFWALLEFVARRSSRIPSVPGIALLQLKSVSRFVEQIDAWAAQHGATGVFTFQLMGKKHVVCCSYDSMMQAMALRPWKLQRPSALRAAVQSVSSGNGLFSAEGAEWSIFKRHVTPSISSHKNVGAHLPVVKQVSQRLVSKWRTDVQARPGEALAINADLLSLVSDITASIAFAFDLDSLTAQSSQVAKDLRDLLPVLLRRILSPVSFWRIPLIGGALDGGRPIIERLKSFISQRIAECEAARARGERGCSLLDHLVDVSRESEGGLTTEGILGNLTQVFVAGSDTTGHTIAWMLWRLAADPELQRKAAAESLLVNLEAADQAVLLNSVPTLRCLFLEVLRMHGPAPFLLLEPNEPISIGGETFGPGDIIIPAWAFASRQPEALSHGVPGDDPACFNASRWIASDGSVIEPQPNELPLAFGFGHRICPGKDLARLEAIATAAAVLRAFELSAEDGHAPVGSETKYTQQPDREMRLVLAPRADAHIDAERSRSKSP